MNIPASNELALEMIDVAIGSALNTAAVVLEGVNWKVPAGDYWAIGGLQASGKSDFMETAAGIMRPLRGAFRVFGQELGSGFEHHLMPTRLRLGLVFQGGRMLSHLTVAENVALPIRYHQNLALGEAEARTQALLKFIGLSDMAARTPGTLRRNLQQRAGLARALALKPDVLLLDNPLNGLELRERGWWLDNLDKLCAGHPLLDNHPLTIVITDDNLRPWADRARQFGLIKDREFIALGGRSDLMANKDSLVQELLRAEAIAA